MVSLFVQRFGRCISGTYLYYLFANTGTSPNQRNNEKANNSSPKHDAVNVIKSNQKRINNNNIHSSSNNNDNNASGQRKDNRFYIYVNQEQLVNF